jgi:alkanesulfonate monooxygenase SsuD/methylene tetrahydromethanopterin reductase-like flavin-dependent oxidoreductase (luciferase family)
MRNHGTDPARRFGIMRERIEAMKAIWAEDEASYSGRYVNFERIWSWPKPVQKPHPPILVGGNGANVIDRVLAFGDEWMPNRLTDDEMVVRMEELGRRAEEAGRGTIPVRIAGLMRDPARIERLEQAGATSGFFWLPARDKDEIERAFDKYAAAVAEYQGSR